MTAWSSSYVEACQDKTHKPDWVVDTREANYSAFNGYHRTPSAYSAIRCTRCGAVWRSKGKYVQDLPDAKETL